MRKKIYVIGHRNPDTDSVVSAAAYARLKQLQGQEHCAAARAGKINRQTEYIFERFGMPLPQFLPDLIPKAEHYVSDAPLTVNEDDSLWNALELLQKDDSKVLPIVDKNGMYKSMFHYRSFAQYIITNISPRKKSAFSLSLDHLAVTIHAQPITLFSGNEIRKSPIVVAASNSAHFRKNIQAEGVENALVIVGDRADIHKYCIELGVRALILSNGNTLSKELVDLAEKNKVTVLISPFDTSSTAMLIIYSVTVGKLGDASVPVCKMQDTVRSFRQALSKAPSRHMLPLPQFRPVYYHQYQPPQEIRVLAVAGSPCGDYPRAAAHAFQRQRNQEIAHSGRGFKLGPFPQEYPGRGSGKRSGYRGGSHGHP